MTKGAIASIVTGLVTVVTLGVSAVLFYVAEIQVWKVREVWK